ncbi:transketolase family protein [Prauserella flavalba]|uniref:Transketolase-like pyrimidine-binding domain-containing protein n=1 Tax=Prauserella flavalba TaxID=1477506 RepID=A0A318M146_9PSEU|nr:transketolase C-terminal domain-containing protein [Prauserella flavalba]PXY36255.1 hypothetical protein BA062_12565 [Prauserella flavalba]
MTSDITERAWTPEQDGSWDLATSYRLCESFVAGQVLADLADHDDRIAVLTADLKFSNRTRDFELRHPDRFVNTGICEQNMVSMAAGMATCGYVPYVATFASFIGLLCAEQIRTDLAYPNLPVRIIAHHTGISLGFYGTSHHATEDIGITRSIANLTVLGPADAVSLGEVLRQTVDVEGPVYFRIGRGRDEDVYGRTGARFEFGRLTTLREGTDAAIVATGVTLAPALRAAEELAREGVSVAVVDAHTLRPFDAEGLCELASRVPRILVAEEHNVYTGLASACADALVDGGVGGVRLHRLGLPVDEYALIGPPTRLYEHYDLDTAGIVRRMRNLLA